MAHFGEFCDRRRRSQIDGMFCQSSVLRYNRRLGRSGLRSRQLETESFEGIIGRGVRSPPPNESDILEFSQSEISSCSAAETAFTPPAHKFARIP